MEEKKLKGGSPVMNKLKEIEQDIDTIHEHLVTMHPFFQKIADSHNEKVNQFMNLSKVIRERQEALEERYKTVEMMFFFFSFFAIGLLVKLVIWG